MSYCPTIKLLRLMRKDSEHRLLSTEDPELQHFLALHLSMLTSEIEKATKPRKPRPSPHLHKTQLLQELIQKGTTKKGAAKHLGMARSTVYRLLQGDSRGAKPA